MITLRDAIDRIFAHPVFENIATELPLSITAEHAGGSQAPYKDADFTIALQTHKQYTCGANFFWVNHLYSPSAGVPIRKEAVQHLMATSFPKPTPFNGVLTVSCLTVSSVLDARGALESCTPDELRHAYILAISRDVDAQQDDDLSVLQSWRKFCLSTTTTFHLHESHEARYWASLQLRENAGATAEAVCRTSLQRIFEVVRFRSARVKVLGAPAGTAVAVAKAYSDKLYMANNGVQVTKSFIDVALTVHDRMFKRARIADVLVEADSGPRDSNPFESIYVLQAILSRGQTEPRIFWIVASIHHMCQYKIKPARWFTVSNVRGSTESGNRGYCDLALFKLDSLGHLFGQLPQELGLETQWFERNARRRLETHQLYYCHGQSPEGHPAADTTWQAGQKRSVRDYIQFVQACRLTSQLRNTHW
ncbi:hypothetical protein [Limnohabitans sp.]|uniref:hypothetical protein n=1 Tax=Limnohabitans sp. TaxID=1907725 RepID=UPI00334009E7